MLRETVYTSQVIMQVRFELYVFNVSFQLPYPFMNLNPDGVFFGANVVFMSKTISFEVEGLAFWNTCRKFYHVTHQSIHVVNP